MLILTSLFALGSDADILPTGSVTPLGHGAGLVAQELLWIAGAAFGLLLLLLVWAKYFRGSHRHGRHHSRRRHHSSPTAVASGGPATEAGTEDIEDEATPPHRRHRRRKRRRDHRTRNPTLAETGGLLPLRPNEPSTPTPPP